MSMKLMVKIMEAKVGNPIRKLVLLKLADNANDKGECWPSYQHIADHCEIDRSTVRRHIKQLQSDGYLTIENRRGDKGNSSNMYRISASPVGTESTPIGNVPTPPVGTESTRTSNYLEPVNEQAKRYSGAVTLKTHIDNCKENGESAIPASNRVFRYADEVGIPHEFLWLAWKRFVDYYRDGQGSKKKYIDWPATFCNYVKNNYGKLWWINDFGEYVLTTAGKQAQREFAENA